MALPRLRPGLEPGRGFLRQQEATRRPAQPKRRMEKKNTEAAWGLFEEKLASRGEVVGLRVLPVRTAERIIKDGDDRIVRRLVRGYKTYGGADRALRAATAS